MIRLVMRRYASLGHMMRLALHATAELYSVCQIPSPCSTRTVQSNDILDTAKRRNIEMRGDRCIRCATQPCNRGLCSYQQNIAAIPRAVT